MTDTWRAANAHWYDQLPAYSPDMAVRCPTKNRDGTEIADDDVRGCGGTNLLWTGEDYDCLDCAIFFADFAAEPPHRREEARGAVAAAGQGVA